MAGFVTITPLTIGADGSGTTQNTVQAAVNNLAGQVQTAVNGVTGGRGVSQVLPQPAAPVSVTGTLAETTLATVAIPAGAMGVNGSLEIMFRFSYSGNTNNKTLTLKLGGTIIFTRTRNSAAANAEVFPLILVNRGALNSQVELTATQGTGSPWGGNFVSNPSTYAIDMSVAQNLIATGTLGNAGDTITLEVLSVKIANP